MLDWNPILDWLCMQREDAVLSIKLKDRNLFFPDLSSDCTQLKCNPGEPGEPGEPGDHKKSKQSRCIQRNILVKICDTPNAIDVYISIKSLFSLAFVVIFKDNIKFPGVLKEIISSYIHWFTMD